MEIRRLSNEDIPLMKETFENSTTTVEIEDLHNFINTANCSGFIVIIADIVVGFAVGYHLLRPNGKKMFLLHSFDVNPKYRDQQVEPDFLIFILDYAKETGCSEAFVITDKGNTQACRLYEKYGGRSDDQNEVVYVFDFTE